MPFLDIESIKRDTTLKMVLDHIAWKPLRTRDGQARGKCPLHASVNPKSVSFAVKADGWYCHKCNVGGDQVALWMCLYHLDTYAALVDMCRVLGTTAYELPRHQWKARGGNGEGERL